MAIGMILGSAIGAVSGIMQQKSQNDAIEEQIKFNNKLLEMNDKLLQFNQSLNLNRANEAILSYSEDISKSVRETEVQANQQISEVQNVQLSGITAGNTKERRIQTAYREVGAKIGTLKNKGELIVNQISEQARSQNEQIQNQKINSFNQTLAKNAQLAGQAITGANAALLVANSAIKYGSAGNSLETNYDNRISLENKNNTDQSFLDNKNNTDIFGNTLQSNNNTDIFGTNSSLIIK